MKFKTHEYLKNNIKNMSKKITLLIAFIGIIGLQSCTVNEESAPIGDNDTISEVWEFNRSFTASNNYSNLVTFPHTIFTSDMVLVYRLTGTDNGADVWKLLPETYFFSDGTLDFGYDFDFTQNNTFIKMIGNDLATVPTSERLNQIIRVVVIPGYFGNKNTITVNFNDYNAVVSAYKIEESKIVKIK
jgi:hypothetical protein